jgi:MYXO-CTERM domain-containing protein
VLALLVAGCSDAGIETEMESIGTVQQAAKEACPPDSPVLGIDIASYQHPGGAAIDWAQVAAARRFVIIKATEGTGYTNPYYADDAVQARAAGMYVGAYHWLHFTTSGSAQADYFLDAIGGSVPPGDLPPMLDVEEPNDSATPAERVAHMQDWLERVEIVTGRKPMIYSGSWYWDGYLDSPQGYNDYPFCWAAYVDGCPLVPDYFPQLTMWQYLGGEGSTPGIDAACDQDMFYGTEAELAAFAAGGADYRGTSLGIDGQSYPIVADGAVDVHQGETVTGWVRLANEGKATWEPGVVWLAPIPRDVASPFEAASWLSATRISTVAAPVPPGEVGEFELDIRGGGEQGESILSLGWVAEGITWFADPPAGGGPEDGYFAVRVNVTEPLPNQGGGEPGEGGAGGAGGADESAGSGGLGVLPTTAGIPEGNDEGCSCRLRPTSRSSGGWLAAMGALAGARRRSRRRDRG